MNVTGCIVTYNNIDTIERCIHSIFQNSKKYAIKLFLVDNGSTDGTVERVRSLFPDVKIIQNYVNVGFGAGHNQIIPYLKEQGYHFVINPDIWLRDDAIAALVDFMEQPNPQIAACTPEILNEDGTRQCLPQEEPSVRYVLISKLPGFKYLRKNYTRELIRQEKPIEIAFCTGCFFCIRSALFKKLNGFDERYFMYFEDADLSKRVRCEGSIYFNSKIKVTHAWKRDNVKSVRGQKIFLKSMILYFSKWGWKF